MITSTEYMVIISRLQSESKLSRQIEANLEMTILRAKNGASKQKSPSKECLRNFGQSAFGLIKLFF